MFDRWGKGVAYISTDEDLTIYTFDGKPTVYLFHKGEMYYIYGFNGKHLGWYEDGIVRDHRGDAVGFTEGIIRIHTEIEPLKSVKHEKPFKARIEEPPIKPLPSRRWSTTALSIFLQSGREK